MPAFAGQPIKREQPLFWQWGGGKAIRDGRWKLVSHGRTPRWELYDLEHDRTELADLSSKHPDRVKQMSTKWEQWYESARARR